MRLVRLALVIAGFAAVLLAGPSSSYAVDLPACTDITCAFNGDFTVQSMPLSGVKIPSSPGQIQDGVVLYTGSSGTGVTTNFAGMDGAFAAPSGKNKNDPTFTSTKA